MEAGQCPNSLSWWHRWGRLRRHLSSLPVGMIYISANPSSTLPPKNGKFEARSLGVQQEVLLSLLKANTTRAESPTARKLNLPCRC